MDKYGLSRPPEDSWRVLIQSFSPRSLQKIHAIRPNIPLIQLFFGSETSQAIQERLAATSAYAVGIGPRHTSLDRALVDAAHARSLQIHPYTVNDKLRMEQLIALGVDGMFTNFPDLLDEVLDEEAVVSNRSARVAADMPSAVRGCCRTSRPGRCSPGGAEVSAVRVYAGRG